MLRHGVMTSPNRHLADFLAALETALSGEGLIKLSLGHYVGAEDGLKQIVARPVEIRRAKMIALTYRYKSRDIVKNYLSGEALRLLTDALANGFTVATLFTPDQDVTLEIIPGRKSALRKGSPTQAGQGSLSHDRAKTRVVATQGKSYLTALGVTDATGQVLKSAQDKYRQIDKFVEILGGLIETLPADSLTRVVDMGSGKGYLTFALADYLASTLKSRAKVTGVEQRFDMVTLCNDIARQSGLGNLDFAEGTISSFSAERIDILIALHACDTATDDAIAKGVAAGAHLIVVAPCCHKQVRREMEKAEQEAALKALLRHGVFMERQAEMATDALRALMLEYLGYKTKVFEFISDAHTQKNVMITAVKTGGVQEGKLREIDALKRQFSIRTHYLEKALSLPARPEPF